MPDWGQFRKSTLENSVFPTLLFARAALDRYTRSTVQSGSGEVAEWLNAPHSKCGIRATVSGVRIPPSPPLGVQTLAPFPRGDAASDPVVPKDESVAVPLSAAPEPSAAAIPGEAPVACGDIDSPRSRHVGGLDRCGEGEPKRARQGCGPCALSGHAPALPPTGIDPLRCCIDSWFAKLERDPCLFSPCLFSPCLLSWCGRRTHPLGGPRSDRQPPGDFFDN